MEEAAAIDIAKCQVRHPNVADIPHAGRRGVAIGTLAEERQLKSESPSLRGVQISSVVPPLGLEFRMIEMVAGKLVMKTGKRDSIGSLARPEKRKGQTESE